MRAWFRCCSANVCPIPTGDGIASRRVREEEPKKNKQLQKQANRLYVTDVMSTVPIHSHFRHASRLYGALNVRQYLGQCNRSATVHNVFAVPVRECRRWSDCVCAVHKLVQITDRKRLVAANFRPSGLEVCLWWGNEVRDLLSVHFRHVRLCDLSDVIRSKKAHVDKRSEVTISCGCDSGPRSRIRNFATTSATITVSRCCF